MGTGTWQFHLNSNRPKTFNNKFKNSSQHQRSRLGRGMQRWHAPVLHTERWIAAAEITAKQFALHFPKMDSSINKVRPENSRGGVGV